MQDKNDHFEVLRRIQKKPNSSQRQIAEDLGFSLGKLNYCLKALQKKGLLKIQNFRKQPNEHRHLRTTRTKKGAHRRHRPTCNKQHSAPENILRHAIEEGGNRNAPPHTSTPHKHIYDPSYIPDLEDTQFHQHTTMQNINRCHLCSTRPP